jgi:hypothetical protein
VFLQAIPPPFLQLKQLREGEKRGEEGDQREADEEGRGRDRGSIPYGEESEESEETKETDEK